jgi:hypothetical protein
MTAIVVKAFGGMKPIVNPLLLDSGDAQLARNVRLISGAIAPLRGTTTLKSTTSVTPQTIYRYGTSSTETNYWLEFPGDVDVVRSPIAADQYDRLYWTDGTAPRYAPNSLIVSGASYPGASYLLGIPKPTTAPSITASTAPTEAAKTESRTYVITYVSAYGEEGPPSDASAVVSVDNTQSVTVSIPGNPGGNRNLTLKRIYRSSTVGSRAYFQFVAEVPIATTSYVDTKSQADLGEVLPSENWKEPPSGLKGLRMMATGVAVGFVGNTVYLSEPNLPHAWPHQYPLDAEIVGIGTFGQTVVALTKTFPYVLQGVDPAAMSTTKMELRQACVSKRSIVETGDGVMFASPDGIVSIGGGGIQLVTQNILSRDQWQAYKPDSLQAYLYNGRWHGFYNTGSERGLLIFDFTGQGAYMTVSDLGSGGAQPITAGFQDASTDTLYLCQGSFIVRFDSGSSLPYLWRSKLFRVPQHLNFSVAQVRAAAYPVTLRVYADGALKFTKSVSSEAHFRLPSGFKALDWYVEIEGTSDVTEFFMATSVAELMQV